jgi:MFS family permease
MQNTKQFYGWWILAGLFVLLMVTVGLMINSFGFFFKPVSDELHFTMGEFSLNMSILAICGMLAAILVGKLINRVLIRVLTTVSAIIYIAGYLLYARCTTLNQFYLTSAVVGFGMVGLYGPAAQIVANWFQDKQGLVLAVVAVVA